MILLIKMKCGELSIIIKKKMFTTGQLEGLEISNQCHMEPLEECQIINMLNPGVNLKI